MATTETSAGGRPRPLSPSSDSASPATSPVHSAGADVMSNAAAPLHRSGTFPAYHSAAENTDAAAAAAMINSPSGGANGNGNDNNDDGNIALLVPLGLRLRDEFVCPITRELIVEPVIAADGHTYDRSAIERWIHRSTSRKSRSSRRNNSNSDNVVVTSPKTGQTLDHLHLIPNHNLKRLLRDMIREGGGTGLWCREDGTSVVNSPPAGGGSGNNVAMNAAVAGLSVVTNMAPLSPAASFAEQQQQQQQHPLQHLSPHHSHHSLISPASTIVEEDMASTGSPRHTFAAPAAAPSPQLQPQPRPMSPLSPALSPASSSLGDSVGVAAGGGGNLTLSPRLQSLMMQQQQAAAAAAASPRPPAAQPRLALVRTRVVRCRCLGPPESDWNGRTFRFAEPPSSQPRSVSRPQSPAGEGRGRTDETATAPSLMGGRRRPHEGSAVAAAGPGSSEEFVQFADATVSRRHFELRYVSEDDLLASSSSEGEEGEGGRRRKALGKLSDFGGELLDDEGNDRGELSRLLRGGKSSSASGGGGSSSSGRRGWFVLRDLGSAGGTFVRIPPGRGARLSPGSMIMLGKHQLVALAPPPPSSSSPAVPVSAGEEAGEGGAAAVVEEGSSAEIGGSSTAAAENSNIIEREEAGANNNPPAVNAHHHHPAFASRVAAANAGNAGNAVASSSSCPLSPSSVVAGTDIVTPRYAELRAGEERRRFFFTERGSQQLQQRDGSGGAVTDSISASISTTRAFSSRSAATIRTTPDLNETTEEDEIGREEGHLDGGDGGSSEGNDGDDERNIERDVDDDDDDKEEDLNVDVSYDDEENEVEVSIDRHHHQRGGAGDRRTDSDSSGGRSGARGAVMTMSDLGLTLPALSYATTTDAGDEEAAGSGDSEVQEDQDAPNDRRGDERLPPPSKKEDGETCQEGRGGENEAQNEEEEEEEARRDVERPLLILKCFAPEGTPLQNRRYPLTRFGATLGRKATNVISFSHRVGPGDLPEGGANGGNGTQQLGAYVGIDSSISGEHARVTYDEDGEGVGGCLKLYDGSTPSSCSGRSQPKGSTNGTWLRLSPMHEPSGWFVLEDKMEVLVGTVRFQVEMDEIVVERDIYD